LLKQRLESSRKCSIIALDDYLKMTPDEQIWEDDVYEVTSTMCQKITEALENGYFVIVDHVITSKRIYEAILQSFMGRDCFKVLVRCDIETLKKREKERGNRCIGSAEVSLEYLYPKDNYDLTVDTGLKTTEQIVDQIIKYL
jgi:chloramphenicol 3-O phosphotransferase